MTSCCSTRNAPTFTNAWYHYRPYSVPVYGKRGGETIVETRMVLISRLFRGQSPRCLPFPTVKGYLFRGVPSRRADNDWRCLLVGGKQRQYRHDTRVVYARHSRREKAIPGRNDIPPDHLYLCFITTNATPASGSETAKVLQLVPHCAPTTYVSRAGKVKAAKNRQGVCDESQERETISQQRTRDGAPYCRSSGPMCCRLIGA
jgi:hypothetical protein